MEAIKLSEKTKEKIIWLLILFSPITMGFLIPFAISGIIIHKIGNCFGSYEDFIIFSSLITYFFSWSVIFKKISGRSAWL